MIEILYQDEYICIINKASGSVVYKTPGAGDSPIILQALRDQLGKKIFPVHRLDRSTSGCLAFALSSAVASKLQASLQQGQKKYQALCLGEPSAEGVIDRELTSEKKVKQPAVTKYKVLESFVLYEPEQKYSLLELDILTGRKHQIRRHLSFLGHHIVGDTSYGKGWLNRRFRDRFGFQRLFLHCHFLSIVHPISGERLSLHCPMTPDLDQLLAKIR